MSCKDSRTNEILQKHQMQRRNKYKFIIKIDRYQNCAEILEQLEKTKQSFQKSKAVKRDLPEPLVLELEDSTSDDAMDL